MISPEGLTRAVGHDALRRRVAAWSLPAHLGQCRTTLWNNSRKPPIPKVRHMIFVHGHLCDYVQSMGRGAAICITQIVRTSNMAGGCSGWRSQKPHLNMQGNSLVRTQRFTSGDSLTFVLFAQAINASLLPPELIVDRVKRSIRGHAFHPYTSLYETVSVPQKAPSA